MHRVTRFGICVSIACMLSWNTSRTAYAALVGRWTFDAGSLLDSSGFGNNGAIVGTAPALISGHDGQASSAYQFTRGQGTIQVPDAPSLDVTTQFTVTAWIRPDDTNSSSIMFKATTSQYSWQFFDWYLGNGIQLQAYQTGTHSEHGYVRNSSGVSTPVGVWSHVAAVFDSTGGSPAMRLYINGVLQPQTAIWSDSVMTIFNSTVPVVIGGGANTLDDLRIYNNALSSAEVAALVPEPSAVLLLITGLATLHPRRSRKYLEIILEGKQWKDIVLTSSAQNDK